MRSSTTTTITCTGSDGFFLTLYMIQPRSPHALSVCVFLPRFCYDTVPTRGHVICANPLIAGMERNRVWEIVLDCVGCCSCVGWGGLALFIHMEKKSEMLARHPSVTAHHSKCKNSANSLGSALSTVWEDQFASGWLWNSLLKELWKELWKQFEGRNS